MTWNFDFTDVPLGQDVTVPRLVADKNSASGKTVRDVTEFQRDDLILASKCGKVIKSYWIPAEERFAGFSKGEQPIAWCAWPEHPNHRNTDAASSSHRLAILDGPSDENGSEKEAPQGDASGGVQDGMLPVHPATHFLFDDAGGGA